MDEMHDHANMIKKLIHFLNFASWVVWTGFPRILLKLPWVWGILLGKTEQDIERGGDAAYLMTVQEAGSQRKDIAGIVESLLSQETWTTAALETQTGILSAKQCESIREKVKERRIPVHSYVAGCFNTERVSTLYTSNGDMPGFYYGIQRKIFSEWNADISTASYYEDDKVTHIKVPWARSFYEFLANVYEKAEANVQ
jgi:hypothetical protein